MKYKLERHLGVDYVSQRDAERLLGVNNIAAIKKYGSCTLSINDGPTLWSLGWLINLAEDRTHHELKPDLQWIQAYKAEQEAMREKDDSPKVPFVPLTQFSEAATSSQRLDTLVQLMPPPLDVPGREQNWAELSALLGVAYPESFRKFVAVYGGLEWFENFMPLVPYDSTPAEFCEYLEGLFADDLRDLRDMEDNRVYVPPFRSDGMWLPFMRSHDGDTFSWITSGSSESWSIVLVQQPGGRAYLLPPMSIIEMFVSFLLNEPLMEDLWGTAEEMREDDPARLSLR